MKVCFETFGCRLNKAEALQMEADYLAKGWERTEKHSDADLFVVRGCSVTRRAQEECEDLIVHLRRRYPTKPIRICGCLEHKDQDPLLTARVQHLTHPERTNALPTRTARAYLKVQDGCSGRCTFCIVPKFRGTSSSVPFDEVMDQARRFIDAGYREIVVTGCNLALYAASGKRLPDLVVALAGLSPDCRIRLGSVEPGNCALETVRAMAKCPNVCRFLHIPVQSGSTLILRAMNRPYRVKDIETLARTATKLMPNLGLGCDLITGFPGESDLDFFETRTLLMRLPFSNVHVFPFSQRPGTKAATLPDQVPHDIRSARAHELSAYMRQERQRCAKVLVGSTVEIVVEDEQRKSGWTGEYFRCHVLGSERVLRKSLVRVSVTKAEGDNLYGHICQAPRLSA